METHACVCELSGNFDWGTAWQNRLAFAPYCLVGLYCKKSLHFLVTSGVDK